MHTIFLVLIVLQKRKQGFLLKIVKDLSGSLLPIYIDKNVFYGTKEQLMDFIVPNKETAKKEKSV